MPVPLFWLAVQPAGRTTAGGAVNRTAALAKCNHLLAAQGQPPQAPDWFAPHMPRVEHG